MPATVAGEDDLRAFAIARLGARAPRRLVVRGRIPRTAQGKVVRDELMRIVRTVLMDRRAK